MAIGPEPQRTNSIALPWLPLPAILGFSLLGVGGALVLTYSTFSYAEAKRAESPANGGKVYEARAIPFEFRRETPTQREAITRALTATQADVHRDEIADERANISQPTLLADSDRELRGFPGFGNFAGANSYIAVTGTSFGISAASLPSGFAAADSEIISAPVPETSTWLCGGALVLLVGARGVRAKLHRKRRRE